MKFFLIHLQKRTKVILAWLALLTTLLCTGCWDNQDLSDLAIAIAVGFDGDGISKVEATVQLVKPRVIKASMQGSTEEAFWTYSATGETPYSALGNLLTTVNRRIFFSDVQVIVIGEEVARNGLMNVLDIFERSNETNRQSYILIARNVKAKDVLEARSELEKLPALHLREVIANSKSLAKIREIQLFQLLHCLNCEGYSPAVSMIERKGVGKPATIKDLEVHGASIFQEGKLVGWLDPIETRGLVFALGEVNKAIVNTRNPYNREKDVSFEIMRATGEMDAELKEDGSLLLCVTVKAEGRLVAQQGTGDLTTYNMVKLLEADIAKVIERNISDTLDIAHTKFRTDFFGFAPVIQRKYPGYWEEIKDKWNQVFTTSPVNIKVTFKIRTPSLIREPTTPR